MLCDLVAHAVIESMPLADTCAQVCGLWHSPHKLTEPMPILEISTKRARPGTATPTRMPAKHGSSCVSRVKAEATGDAFRNTEPRAGRPCRSHICVNPVDKAISAHFPPSAATIRTQ